MIELNKITKTYGKGENVFHALSEVTLKINSGESVAIIGKSGSGKSTLMHIMSGLDRPTSGEIIVNDQALNNLSGSALDRFRNQTIGFIFQTFFLQPNESVLANVMFPLEIKGLSYSERKDAALKALAQVDLSEKANSNAKDLSGGQKQRVCIARALVTNPDIIFADEPTGNLDTQTGELIVKLLFDIQKNQGKTLIVVTHDNDLADMCERKIKIQDGKIV